MTDGRRWLALDADMFGKRFTHDLYDRFGPTGVAVWVAFLCACKQSRVPGRIKVMNSTQAAYELGIAGWELVDNKGEPWDLDDFWTFTGRKKQTRRTPHGRRTDARRTPYGQCFDVVATHWERWQKRTSGAKNSRPDLDLDLDIPPTPPRGSSRRSAPNGKGQPEPTARPVPDWQPEPEATADVVKADVANLRANPSGKP